MMQAVCQCSYARGVKDNVHAWRCIGMLCAKGVHFNGAAVELLNIHLTNLTHAPVILHHRGVVQREKGLLRMHKQLAIEGKALPLFLPAASQRMGEGRALREAKRFSLERLRLLPGFIFFFGNQRQIATCGGDIIRAKGDITLRARQPVVRLSWP